MAQVKERVKKRPVRSVDIRPGARPEVEVLFAFLANALLFPLSAERWNTCKNSCRSLFAILPGGEAFAGTLDRAFLEERAALDEEYHALFSGVRFPSLMLWESCYDLDPSNSMNKDKRLLNSVTLDVADHYRRGGVHADEAFLRQPPDHIGVECAFFAWLCRPPELECLHELKRSFFHRHLWPFAEKFAAALEERAHTDVYRGLARLLAESVALDFLQDAEGDGGFPTPPPGLRLLTAEERERGAEVRLVPVCGVNNCGGRCPMTAKVSEGCVLELRAARQPEGRPKIMPCARGFSYHRTFLNGERLRYPLRRVGERGEAKFQRISWEEALESIAAETARIGAQYGPQSRYVNYAFGVNCVAKGYALAKNLLALDGGFLDNYNSYSTACTTFTTPYTYGTAETGNCSEDLLNSKLILLWGHNPVETVFGSTLRFYLGEAKRRGIEIVVVDPRFSDTAAAFADRWIGLRPTTDGALMAAMAFTILSEGLQDQAFMDRFCLGFDEAHMPAGMEDQENYGGYVLGKYDGTPKTPEWAEEITGVDAETIRWLARKYATAKPAALLQGYGPQRNGNGEQTVRGGTLLACLTGNVGVPGGSACGYGAVRLHPEPVILAAANPYPGKIPSFLWTDAIIRGSEMTALQDGVMGVEKLDANVKLIFNLAGNALINQHSDINRSVNILKDTSLCEFIVCSDLFLTPSARFADILLPGTSMFEGENIGKPWHEGDYLLYCNRAAEPLFECRFEYDWLADVAGKLGHWEAFTHGGKDLRGLLRESYEAILGNEQGMPDFDTFRALGIYRYRETPHFVAFQANVRDPDRHPFPTPSGKIEIFSPRLLAKNNPREIPAIPKYVPSFEGLGDPLYSRYPFQLVGWHTKRRCHSIHDNNPDMEGLEPHKLWIHPEDAERKNIGEDDWVEVFNDRGRLRIRARVTDRVVRGVVALSQGGWYRPDADGVDLRGCLNTLSTARPTPLAKGNPQHSNLVDIKRI
ncbi:MAG: molybdopterin-dependent oxidoreductase [Synergistaceae bacterium]|jgi:anaerobic dimethyl sulfoxide reductase subunit A|nr:molybdopterin-dependent oxidoreductase [Synergistaceae bacterium]